MTTNQELVWPPNGYCLSAAGCHPPSLEFAEICWVARCALQLLSRDKKDATKILEGFYMREFPCWNFSSAVLVSSNMLLFTKKLRPRKSTLQIIDFYLENKLCGRPLSGPGPTPVGSSAGDFHVKLHNSYNKNLLLCLFVWILRFFVVAHFGQFGYNWPI